MTKPDYEYLAECFEYNLDDGTLAWRQRPENHFHDYRTSCVWNALHAGKPAGFIHPNTGYRMVTLNNRSFLANQIVWVLHNGEWPTCRIKRINRVTTDDRIENLAEAGTSNQDKGGRKSMEITTDWVFVPKRDFEHVNDPAWGWLTGRVVNG